VACIAFSSRWGVVLSKISGGGRRSGGAAEVEKGDVGWLRGAQKTRLGPDCSMEQGSCINLQKEAKEGEGRAGIDGEGVH